MSLRLLLGGALSSVRFTKAQLIFGAVLLVCTANANRCAAQLCGQLSGVNFAEDFNSLSASGGTNSLPNSFEFAFVKSSGLGYAADNGSLSTANAYSYGTTGSTERALGELTSSSQATTIGACFTNNTNHTITSFLIGYTGEEWRLGVADGTVDRLDFQFSTDAGAINSGTYLNVDELDFTTPANSGAGSKDGNTAANRTVFAPTAITPAAPIQPEKTFYIRWLSSNISGANDGLAIDDFSIGTSLAPGVAGDYNDNGVVDAGDYAIWRKRLNQSATIPNDITPGTVVTQDYTEWRSRFGKTTFDFGTGSSANIPEPVTTHLAAMLVSVALVFRCSRHRFVDRTSVNPLSRQAMHPAR
jgi:hypothetical protein